jgi:hypothetical protein
MRDSVEQLRADSLQDAMSSDKAIHLKWEPIYVMKKAAEEIERLRAALQEIANSDERIAEVQRSSHCISSSR